jgi:glycosyltransferase involved in cell wall biosynthesis
MIVLHHSDVQRQRTVALAYRPIARRVARRAAAVVVATRSHLNHAADVGAVPESRIRVIPFGVDERTFSPQGSAPPPDVFQRSGPGPIGLFVGRLVSYKGLDVLVRAVAGTDLRVVVVGDGPLRSSVEAEIRAAGLRDRILLTGEVEDADLPAYYRAADYFVLPSTTPAEMFGISLLEAMACGKPVISTMLTSGVREVNEAGVTGLAVAPGNAAALRDAMLQLSSDGDLRARLGAAGRRRVEERFTLTRMVDAHLALCAEMAKLRGGTG